MAGQVPATVDQPVQRGARAGPEAEGELSVHVGYGDPESGSRGSALGSRAWRVGGRYEYGLGSYGASDLVPARRGGCSDRLGRSAKGCREPIWQRETIDVSLAVKEAKFALRSVDTDNALSAKLDDILAGNNPTYTQREALGKAYIQRLRATRSESATGHVFVNGRHHPFHPQIVHILHQTIQEQIQVLAPQIYYGQISSSSPGLETFFYDSVGALSFRSALVGGSGSEAGGVRHGAVDLFSALVDGEVGEETLDKVFKFFYPSSGAAEDAGEGRFNSTVWVLADLDSRDGLALLTRAFEALAQDEAVFRLGLLHLPSTQTDSGGVHSSWISTLAYRLLAEGKAETLSPAQMLTVLRQAHDDPHVPLQQLEALLDSAPHGIDDASNASRHFWTAISPTIASKLGISSNPAILVDGHLVSNLTPSSLEARDITALVEYEAGQKLPFLTQALSLLHPDFDSMPPRQRQDCSSPRSPS